MYASLICEMYPAVEVGTTTALAAVEHETAPPPCSSPTSWPVDGSTKHLMSETAVGEVVTEDE